MAVELRRVVASGLRSGRPDVALVIEGQMDRLPTASRESHVALSRLDPSTPASTPAPRVVLTAFHPFAGDARNPSAEVLAAVAGSIDGLIAEVLPVEFAAAGQRVGQLIADHRPAAWIGLGLHGGATSIALERRAANADDANLADNAGDVRLGVLIDPAGPPFRPATLPLDRLMADLTAAGLPARFSDSAGRFVCNHVFYRAAAAAERLATPPRVGFIHLPWPADWPAGARATPAHKVTFAALVSAIRAVLAVV